MARGKEKNVAIPLEPEVIKKLRSRADEEKLPLGRYIVKIYIQPVLEREARREQEV